MGAKGSGMRKPLLAALSLVLFTSACGGFGASRWNPMNWFGGAEQAAPAEPNVVDQEDPRALAMQVTALKVDPMPGGAIVRATAVMPTQGWWEAELLPVQDPPTDGNLVYEFRVFPPVSAADVSTARSRTVNVAVFVSDIKLDMIRSITVQGATNGLTTRR